MDDDNRNLSPLDMNNKYFLEHLSKTINYYSTKYDNLGVMGDFNLELTTDIMEIFCDSSHYNLVKENICFKAPPPPHPQKKMLRLNPNKQKTQFSKDSSHNNRIFKRQQPQQQDFQKTIATTTGFSKDNSHNNTIFKRQQP